MRIGHFHGQDRTQTVEQLVNVVIGVRQKIGQVDFFGLEAVDLGQDHLQRALKQLNLPAHRDEVAHFEGAEEMLTRVPEPGRQRAGAIAQLHLQIQVAVAVGSHLLVGDEEDLLDIVAVGQLLNHSPTHAVASTYVFHRSRTREAANPGLGAPFPLLYTLRHKVCPLTPGKRAMPAVKKMLAFDLGAESGRAILGTFDGGRLELDVLHRFPNGPVRTLDSMHWNILGLYQELLNGLRKAAGVHGSVDSIGVDSWGVDFGLLGRGGVLLGNPRHYRDPFTEGVMDAAVARLSKADIYRRTGLQFLRFNTLFQLLALQRDRSPLLDAAENLLLIPDLFHYFFTGIKSVEFTNASTTQMLDPGSRSWAFDLVQAFGLPAKILGSIVTPGTVLGPLRSSVAVETGLTSAPVIAPATHDTGSAIAAVPAKGEAWAYISSGTWSLMGVELARPHLTEQALLYNFTNEGGVDGSTRLLKNIMGLWLVQECRRAWEKSGKVYEYAQLALEAEQAPAFRSLIDPDDPSFMLPASMPAAIADFCRHTEQPAPTEAGSVVRCALESLALKYRWVLERLEELLQRPLDVIHIVGGGCQNKLLCQFTADACNRPVYAGPVEATAIGNLLQQARGLGIVGSLADAREIVRQSYALEVYEPRQAQAWADPYARFCRLLPGRSG